MENKYQDAIAASQVCVDDAKVTAAVADIMAKHFEENKTEDVYKFLLNTIDLTTLSSEDSEKSVTEFVQKVNDFETNYLFFCNVIFKTVKYEKDYSVSYDIGHCNCNGIV